MRMRSHNSWLLGLLILLAAATDPVAQGDVGRSTKVSFDLYQGYLIVVRGSAGSQRNLNFLLDTGTNVTILDRKLARKLNLHQEPEVVGGLGAGVAVGRS